MIVRTIITYIIRITNTKLTLKLNDFSILRAKEYSAKNKISLSELVEKFFDGLTLDSQKSEIPYSSLVQELSGIISLPEDYDYKAEYLSHIEEKYK